MLYLKSNLWWLLAARGIFALILGSVSLYSNDFFSYTSKSFAIFTLLWGFLMVLNGEVIKHQVKLWWLSSLEGITEICMGATILSFPEYETKLFLVTIPIWAQMIGLIQIVYVAQGFSLKTSDIPVFISGTIALSTGLLFLFDYLTMFNTTEKVGFIIVVIGAILLFLSFKIKERDLEIQNPFDSRDRQILQ